MEEKGANVSRKSEERKPPRARRWLRPITPTHRKTQLIINNVYKIINLDVSPNVYEKMQTSAKLNLGAVQNSSLKYANLVSLKNAAK